jgi:hypothetical protein
MRKDRQYLCTVCKSCDSLNAKIYYQKQDKEQINKAAKKRYQADPVKAAELRRAHASGAGVEEYKRLQNLYGNLCNICGTKDKIGGKSLAYDHDHKTKKFRGFLCINCNQGLGKFFDNIELLECAIKYLSKGES